MTIKEICDKYSLGQTALSNRFGIPLRTVQDWHSGRRNPPEYVVGMIVEILESDSVTLPCPIGSDCWWVDDYMNVYCAKGGITGFVILKDKIFALDDCEERMVIHGQWCCLSKEEAEAFREKMLKEKQ